MILAGKSVLVTGGTGFIGSRLVEKLVLEQQARVRVVVRDFRHASRIARFPVEMVAGDVASTDVVEKAVRGCEVVFHCAYDSGGSGYQQRRTGVLGTRNVSEAVLRDNVRRLVHVSTFAVYGRTKDGDLTEVSPWRQSEGRYVEIKRAAERLVLDLHRRRNLPVVVVQPTLVYGPFSPWTVATVKNLNTGLVPLVNGGAGYCNAVYVDDAVDAMLLAAAEPDISGETFLISGERPVTWEAFYSAFEAALGVNATVSVSEGELREAMRKPRRRSGALSMAMRWARDPQTVSELARLPFIQTILGISRNYLSEEQVRSIKSWITHESRNREMNGRAEKRICLPSETLLALYRSRTRVCIDKAKQRLGYLPKFDLERGMDLTTRFIQWANLGKDGSDRTRADGRQKQA